MIYTGKGISIKSYPYTYTIKITAFTQQNSALGLNDCGVSTSMWLDVSSLGWDIESWSDYVFSPCVNCRIESYTNTWIKWSCDMIGCDLCKKYPDNFGTSGTYYIYAKLRSKPPQLPDLYCANGICDSGEAYSGCPLDCRTVTCGNGLCEGLEPYKENRDPQVMCPTDCGIPEYCGNGICGIGETCSNCQKDCGVCQPICNNGICESGETQANCPSDCGIAPPVCGNRVCESDETYFNCITDCPVNPCGDGVCESTKGENKYNCPNDCLSECAVNQDCVESLKNCDAVCVFGVCDIVYLPHEPKTCPDGTTVNWLGYSDCSYEDCPTKYCGNGVCETSEDFGNCPQDCEKIPEDKERIPIGILVGGLSGTVIVAMILLLLFL